MKYGVLFLPSIKEVRFKYFFSFVPTLDIEVDALAILNVLYT